MICSIVPGGEEDCLIRQDQVFSVSGNYPDKSLSDIFRMMLKINTNK